MPTIVYYPEPIEVEISMEEFMRRESAPVRIHEETGRMARRAIAEYDECFAELSAEKQNRRAKYLRTHGKDKKPADRKNDKQNRNYRMYGREEQWAKFRFNKNDPQFCRGGWDWYECREGQKNPQNPEMDIFRNRKHDIRERSLRDDWDAEIEDIIEDLDWAFFDAEYLDEQIGMLERSGLEKGDNYVRWNRLWERLKVVNEVIRKNRFVEEMLNDEFGFQNMTEEDYDND